MSRLKRTAVDSESNRRLLDSERTGDCWFLFLLSLASTVPYLGGLGFYSDDWGFMATFYQCKNQSLVGLCRCLWQESRPLQTLELATFYKVFGLNPFGYHVCNSLIFSLAIVFFYLALRELGIGRLISVAVPSVYAFIPHYSTDRFWIAAAQANLSIALFFLCLYFAAKASGANTTCRWLWLWISIISSAGSLFAYETSAPLFTLIPVVLCIRFRRLRVQLGDYSAHVSLRMILSIFLFVTIIVTYKAGTILERARPLHLPGHLASHVQNALLRFWNFNYGAFSFGLPKLAWRSLREHWDPSIALPSAVAWVAITIYLWALARRPAEDTSVKSSWAMLFVTGTVVYSLGCTLFLSGRQFDENVTGISNRVTISMASGTAMSIVGVFGIMASFLSKAWFRNGFLALNLGFLCACGFVVILTEGSYWHTASETQREVLSNIRDHFPRLPEGTILLLDGICPYVGPGIVFETDWDMSGALRLLYRDPTVAGDVIRPAVTLMPNRIVTSIYGNEEGSYPYGDHLLLYDASRHQTCQMKDNLTSQACLASGNWRQNRCPAGSEGAGVPIF